METTMTTDEELREIEVTDRSRLVAYLVGLQRYADASNVATGMTKDKPFVELDEEMAALLDYVKTLQVDPEKEAAKKKEKEEKEKTIDKLINKIITLDTTGFPQQADQDLVK